MVVTPLFRDRIEAGQRLAQRIQSEAIGPNALVLALPRGGVPIGFEIAQILNADLDILLVCIFRAMPIAIPGRRR